jgi:glutamyl-tRNA reductase
VQQVSLITFSHHTLDIQEIGRFHIDEERRSEILTEVKSSCGISELMYLSTCNRVELLLVAEHAPDESFLRTFFSKLLSTSDEAEIDFAIGNSAVYRGEEALRHLFRVAASLDSLVVGEREIITQVRNAYEESHKLGLTGDTIRVIVKKTIHAAKAVYTETDIARNPVSVVSLAYRKLRALNVPLDARFLVIGSGVTNTAMSRYLKKHGYRNFVIFNRTLANAEKLASSLNGKALELSALETYAEGFDVIVTCTASEGTIITEKIYRTLVGNDKKRKVVIDLAVPNDLDSEILNNWEINLIAVNNLQDIASENLKEREKSVQACNNIIEEMIAEFRGEYRQRRVEVAMQTVPKKVKEIRETAMNSVFANEIEQLDPQTKELLEKVINYMEKKYISVPMKMAREILAGEAAEK